MSLGKELQTKTITQSNDQAFWGQELWIPVQTPLVSSRLVMSVYDSDVTTDEIVGSMSFQIHEIIKLSKKIKSFPFLWKNIYGSHLGVSGKHTDEMNAIPEIASCFKGRILMQIAVEKTDKPQLKVANVDEETLSKAEKYFPYYSYEVKFEISQGICLPDTKLKVKLWIGEKELKSKSPKYYTNGYSFWNQRFDEQIWSFPYRTIENIADVFIYIMDGDNPIWYYRGKASEFAEVNSLMKWVPLINDKSIGTITESYKAGMISFKLAIFDSAKGDKLFIEIFQNFK